MTDKPISIYVAHKMTGRPGNELVAEADLVARTLRQHGFYKNILDPIIEENVINTKDIVNSSQEQLAIFWKRDKEMLREADLILDYMSCDRSNGVNNELGYTRFCLWKPVVRVYPGLKQCISRLEDDCIAETLDEAIEFIKENYGTYEKLREWRQELWNRSFLPWYKEQMKMNGRYGVKNYTQIEIV